MTHPFYECQTCNVIFKTVDKKRQAKYCCRECYAESLKQKRFCKVCDKQLRWFQKIFCSRQCCGKNKKGKSLSDFHKKALIGPRPHTRGANAYNYTGTTHERIVDMGRAEYRNWRKSVFERDSYTCVTCNTKGVFLNADHIKPYALFPALRYEIDNGRTLCVECHKKTDTYMGKSRIYKKKAKLNGIEIDQL